MVEGENSSPTTDNEEPSDLVQPIPDGDFETIPSGNDSSRGVKIGSDLPDLAKRNLKLA